MNIRLIGKYVILGLISLCIILGVFNVVTKAGINHINNSKYDALLKLKSDNYTQMTIEEFRSHALDVLFEQGNEKQNQKLLLEALGDEQLHATRFTDESAFFIRNVVVPLTGENWKNEFLYGGVDHPFNKGNGVVEFRAVLTIKDTTMSISDYQKIYSDLYESIIELLDSKSDKDLSNDVLTLNELKSKLSKYAHEINKADKVSLIINDCFYIIEYDNYNSIGDLMKKNGQSEKDSKKLAADVNKVLSLAVDGYENFTLAEYRAFIENKLSSDSSLKSSKNRVMKAINSIPTKLDTNILTDSELKFISYTLSCSIAETAYYVDKVTLPSFNDGFFVKSALVGDLTYVEYAVQYTVKDETRLTVGQRDKAIFSIVNGMKEFVKNAKLDPMDSAYIEEMKKELNRLAEANSSNDLAMEIILCTN